MVITILECTILLGVMYRFSVVTGRKQAAFNKLHLVTTSVQSGDVYRARSQLWKVWGITMMDAATISDIPILSYESWNWINLTSLNNSTDSKINKQLPYQNGGGRDNLKMENEKFGKKNEVHARIEQATFCVLSRRDNHYTNEPVLSIVKNQLWFVFFLI